MHAALPDSAAVWRCRVKRTRCKGSSLWGPLTLTPAAAADVQMTRAALQAISSPFSCTLLGAYFFVCINFFFLSNSAILSVVLRLFERLAAAAGSSDPDLSTQIRVSGQKPMASAAAAPGSKPQSAFLCMIFPVQLTGSGLEYILLLSLYYLLAGNHDHNSRFVS